MANISVTTADYRISDDLNPDIDYDETHLEVTWQHVRKIGEKNYIALLLLKAILRAPLSRLGAQQHFGHHNAKGKNVGRHSVRSAKRHFGREI